MKLFFHVIHEDQPTGTTNVKEKTMGVTTTKKFREFTWNYFGERNETVYPCIPPPPPSHLGKRGSWILHGTITNIRNLHGNNKRRTEWNCFFHVIHEPLVHGDCECERKKMGLTTTKIYKIYMKPPRRTEWNQCFHVYPPWKTEITNFARNHYGNYHYQNSENLLETSSANGMKPCFHVYNPPSHHRKRGSRILHRTITAKVRKTSPFHLWIFQLDHCQNPDHLDIQGIQAPRVPRKKGGWGGFWHQDH